MDRRILLLLALAGCQAPESGLDKSVIQGTVVIPPGAYTEEENRQVDNDSAGSAFGVGPDGATSLSYRAVVATGTTSSFSPSAPGEEYGDADWYAFSPVADGSFSIRFTLPGGAGGPSAAATSTTTGTSTDTTTTDGGTDSGTTTTGGGTDTTTTGGGTDTTTTGGTDSGTTSGGTDSGTTSGGTDSGTTGGTTSGTDTTAYVDAIVYRIRVYDAAAYDGAGGGLLAEGTTDGAAGAWTGSFDVAGGGDYLVEIGGVQNETSQDPVAYQVVYSGSAPGVDAVKVGAYLEGDPAVASNPVGGASATLWQWDDTTLTWTGFYSITYLRSVVNAVDTGGDTAPNTTPPDIDEALTSVFLTAGTLQSLNKSPSAGSLYSSASLEVAVPGQRLILPPDQVLVLDAVFPKVIGRTITETEPDTTFAALDANSILVLDTLVAEDIGMLTGLGYVDVLEGNSDVSSGGVGWEFNDSDAFAFTVPEPMYVSMVASWPDTAADIDFGIFGDYPDYGYIDFFGSFSASSYCMTGADPEVCTLVVPLEPGVTYYILALGYSGSDIQPYHIELEWIGL